MLRALDTGSTGRLLHPAAVTIGRHPLFVSDAVDQPPKALIRHAGRHYSDSDRRQQAGCADQAAPAPHGSAKVGWRIAAQPVADAITKSLDSIAHHDSSSSLSGTSFTHALLICGMRPVDHDQVVTYRAIIVTAR